MRYESFAYEVILSDQLFWTKLVLILKYIQNLYVLLQVLLYIQNLYVLLQVSLFDRGILKAVQVLDRETKVHKISFVILRFTIGAGTL